MGLVGNGLLDLPCDEMRLKHRFVRSQETHANWVKRYIYFRSIRLAARRTPAVSLAGIAVY